MRSPASSVPVLAPEQLSALSIVELSIRKGRLLALPLAAVDAERRRAWQRSPQLDPNSIHHREDPRWLPQWLEARDAAWRRRKEHVEPIWCVVANVVREQSVGPGGAKTRIGTKTLRGGARVFIIDAYFGLGEVVIAIARFRGNGRWIRTAVRVDRLERVRAKLVYEPSVIDACFMHWGRAGWTEKDARASQSAFEGWQSGICG